MWYEWSAHRHFLGPLGNVTIQPYQQRPFLALCLLLCLSIWEDFGQTLALHGSHQPNMHTSGISDRRTNTSGESAVRPYGWALQTVYHALRTLVVSQQRRQRRTLTDFFTSKPTWWKFCVWPLGVRYCEIDMDKHRPCGNRATPLPHTAGLLHCHTLYWTPNCGFPFQIWAPTAECQILPDRFGQVTDRLTLHLFRSSRRIMNRTFTRLFISGCGSRQTHIRSNIMSCPHSSIASFYSLPDHAFRNCRGALLLYCHLQCSYHWHHWTSKICANHKLKIPPHIHHHRWSHHEVCTISFPYRRALTDSLLQWGLLRVNWLRHLEHEPWRARQFHTFLWPWEHVYCRFMEISMLWQQGSHPSGTRKLYSASPAPQK